MSVKIREGREEDAEDLTRLARRAKASWGYPQRWLREWEPELCFSAQYVRNQTVLVAESEGVLIGVVALESSGDPELAHLWVAPESQGSGVGKALVQRAAGVARERGWTSLRIESDPNAQRFYERLGATQVGEVAAPVAGTERTLPVLQLRL